MDSSRFRAIHKYGAILSVVGIAVAVLAYAVDGPNSFLVVVFGWAGPLGAFYFVGAFLTHSTSITSPGHTIGEELLRGVAWYFGALIAWSFIVTGTTVLSATPVTVFGLPALTALGISLVMVATRYLTGNELIVQTEGGQLLVQILGGVVFGFLALYLVLADRAGWWLFGVSLVSIPVGLALRQVLKQRYPDDVGTN